MSYDPKCEELAEYFIKNLLPGHQTKENQKSLAQAIQDSVEAWINGYEDVSESNRANLDSNEENASALAEYFRTLPKTE